MLLLCVIENVQNPPTLSEAVGVLESFVPPTGGTRESSPMEQCLPGMSRGVPGGYPGGTRGGPGGVEGVGVNTPGGLKPYISTSIPYIGTEFLIFHCFVTKMLFLFCKSIIVSGIESARRDLYFYNIKTRF